MRRPHATLPPPRHRGRRRLRRVRRRDGGARPMPRCRSTTGSAAPPASTARTQVATGAPGHVLDRTVTVRFDANVGAGLPWRFTPEKNAIEAQLGEVITVDYIVTNLSARETLRRRRLQRHAAHIRAPISRRSTASASPSRRMKAGETRAHDGGVLCRSGAGERPGRAGHATASRCPTHSIRSASRSGRLPTGPRGARPGNGT